MSSAAKAFKFTTQSVPFIAINMLNYDPLEVKFMIANLQTTFFYKINSLFMLAASFELQIAEKGRIPRTRS